MAVVARSDVRTLNIARRTLGRSLVAMGLVGIFTGLGVAFTGQRMVERAAAGIDDSLAVTSEAIDATVESIQVTSAVVDIVRSGLRDLGATVSTLRSSIAEGRTAIDETGSFVGGALPDALDAVNRVLPTITSIAESVDTALRVVSRAPFGPNYRPAQPFDEAVAELGTALRPLPAQLRSLSGRITAATRSSTQLSSELAGLVTELDRLDTQLVRASTLVDRYQTTAEAAKDVASTSRRSLRADTGAARILLLVLGIVFAVGQLIPLALGSALLAANDPRPVLLWRSGPGGVGQVIDGDEAGDAAGTPPPATPAPPPPPPI